TRASRSSTGKPAGGEKRRFLCRRLAAEQGVAVREAAETPDDVAVLDRVALVERAEQPDQLDGALLIGEILGVLEGQVDEEPQILRDVPVEAGRNGTLCKAERERVRREHVRRAAQRVTRHLIEQEQQRERAGRAFEPGVELAPRCREVQIEKFA